MIKKNVLLTALAIAGFAVTSLAQTVPNYVPSNGLVGWWPFNGNAVDESSNTNDGTVNGATLTADRFGSVNSAYSFNGTTNYIDCGSLSAIPNTVGDITQSAWFLAPINQSSYCKLPIMSKRQVITEGWPSIGGGVNATNKAYYFLNAQNYATGVTNMMYSNNVTNDGIWHLVTGTKSGSIYKLYLDGILQDTLLDSYALTSTSNLIIGYEAMWGFNCERWYAGKLDDIGIWNRALTQQEITNLYNGNICFQTITVTDTLLINTNITGFNPVTYQNTIKIWPNPTNDHITIDNGNLANLTGHQIKISNALGQQVFQSAITQQQFYVDMSTWGGNGIYFVNLINAQGVTIETRKIVLQ
jgi:hypothetical protein